MITVTALDRSDSATKLREETAALIGAFLARFQSAKTRANYRANLRAWFPWTDAAGVDGLAARRAHVEAHIRHLELCGYAPNTICQRWRRCPASTGGRRATATSRATRSSAPAGPANLPSRPRGLSRHELTDFLDAAEARGGDGYACACLLAVDGVRVGELCAIDIEDLGESTWHHTLTLRAATTKGHKPAVIALTPPQRAGHQPVGRPATLRAAAAQHPQTAHDPLQRRLPRRRPVPGDRC